MCLFFSGRNEGKTRGNERQTQAGAGKQNDRKESQEGVKRRRSTSRRLPGERERERSEIEGQISKLDGLPECLAHPGDLQPEPNESLVSPSYVPWHTHGHAIDPSGLHAHARSSLSHVLSKW